MKLLYRHPRIVLILNHSKHDPWTNTKEVNCLKIKNCNATFFEVIMQAPSGSKVSKLFKPRFRTSTGAKGKDPCM